MDLSFWGLDVDLDEHFEVCTNEKCLPIDKSPDRINECIVCLIKSGQVTLNIDSFRYNLEAGTKITVFPQQVIEIIEVSNDFKIMYFTCSTDILSKILFRFPPEFEMFLKDIPTYKVSDTKFIQDTKIIEALEEKKNDVNNICRKDLIFNMIHCFFLELYNRVSQKLNSIPLKQNRKMEIIIDFQNLLKEQYHQQREVRFYAKQLNITPKYLSLITSELTGDSAKSIINNYIITEIKLLLKSTYLTIQEITEKLNFPNQAYLSKYFKEHVGVSPSLYRNLI